MNIYQLRDIPRYTPFACATEMLLPINGKFTISFFLKISFLTGPHCQFLAIGVRQGMYPLFLAQ